MDCLSVKIQKENILFLSKEGRAECDRDAGKTPLDGSSGIEP
jgi:hypothetical protein